MPLSRILALMLLVVWGIVPGRAETFAQWVHAGPVRDVNLTAVPGSLAQVNLSGAPPPPLGLYGYLNLSDLSPDVFPIRVRIMYAGDWDSEAFKPGKTPQAPTVNSQMTPVRVTIERAIASPDKASAVPVWMSPVPIGELMASMTPTIFETVRVEVLGRDGSVVGRRYVGTSQYNRYGGDNRSAVLVHAPEVEEAFQHAGYGATQADGLMPDVHAYAGTSAIWVDSTVVADTRLSDAFWRRLLLQGLTLAGHPSDIQALTTRLGIDSSARILLGRVVSGDDPADFLPNVSGEENQRFGASGIVFNSNPFYSSTKAGQDMHEQLINFSQAYLGLFFFLQALVVIGAFLYLRGRNRVWLWLVVPLFAVGYALLGALLAHFFISTRAEATIEQIEFQHEGWPEASLITSTWHVKMDSSPALYHLPPDSLSAELSGNYYYDQQPGATFTFRQAADASELISAPGAARHGAVTMRSWIPAQAPCDVSADGRLTARRSFLKAWAWDGGEWRELGPLQSGQSVVLSDAPASSDALMNITNENWGGLTSLMWHLRPLFLVRRADEKISGEGIFFGVQQDVDAQLEDAASYRLETHRVVAYQFHLPKRSP